MPRGIFGMRWVLWWKWSAERWFRRHSPLNAALCLISQNQSVVAFSLFLRQFVRVRRQWFKAVAILSELMLWVSSGCLILVLSRFVLSFFFSKSLWVIWLLGLSAKSVSAICYCFALPNEKAILLALLFSVVASFEFHASLLWVWLVRFSLKGHFVLLIVVNLTWLLFESWFRSG